MTASPDPTLGARLDPGSGLPCPYLRAAGGEWRNAVPSRDHVCGALGTPVPVGPEAQRRLCFGVPEDCERYQAALEGRRAVAPVPPGRPIARTAPVVVERGRSPVGPPGILSTRLNTRLLGQAGLVLVMALALLALLIARAVGPDGKGAGATASQGSSPSGGATAAASTGPSPSLSASASPSPSAVASPTPRPSVAPSHTPAPSSSPVAGRTYRVQSGDTLSGIAARFGTTVKILKQLNGITDGSLIRTGQILKLP